MTTTKLYFGTPPPALNKNFPNDLTDTDTMNGFSQQAKQSSYARPHFVITSTFTVTPLQAPLEFWANAFNQKVKIHFTAYNQVFQQLLDPHSELLNISDGCGMILLRWEDWIKHDESKCGSLEKHANEFIRALDQALLTTTSPLFVLICPASEKRVRQADFSRLTRSLEKQLHAVAERNSQLQLLCPDDLQHDYPVDDCFDAYLAEQANIPYTPPAYTAFASLLFRTFVHVNRPAYKVIVLDCDNTLWKGVCGEDGALGVSVSPPYLALQSLMLEHYERGMLLCLCSKNNAEDVDAVFKQHTDMLLTWDHITAAKINWDSKPDNIRALSKALNLGLDSFIFFDDDAVQCAQMRHQCPEVLTFELPKNERDIPDYLKHIWVLDHRSTATTGSERTVFYQENQRRQQVQTEQVDLLQFINSLELTINIDLLTPQYFDRSIELGLRTNQFNLSGQCPTLEALTQQFSDQTLHAWIVSVSDRFGDYGQVGFMQVDSDDDQLKVTDFMLSCRAMGRGVEHAMVRFLARYAQQKDLASIALTYQPSAKNQPALQFLQSLDNIDAPVSGADKRAFWTLSTQHAAEVNLKTTENKAVPHHHQTQPLPKSQALGIDYAMIAQRFATIEAIHKEVESQAHLQGPKKRNDDVIYAASTTEIEHQLCEIWKKLLKVERIGIHDSFFALGGNSLLAVRLVSEIRRSFNVNLNVYDVFSSHQISNLSIVIKTAELSQVPVLDTAPLEVPLTLSFAQQRLWLLDKIDNDNSQYNMPIALQLDGLLDISALTRALQSIVDRHQVLRTQINTLDSGEAIQVVQSPVQLSVPVIDLSLLPDQFQTQTLAEAIKKDACTSFDFTQDLMLRARLLKRSEQTHVLLLTLHHIASDGWSHGILMHELSALYAAFIEGKSNPLAELTLQYSDYAQWQRNWLQGEVLDQQLRYWEDKLKDLPKTHNLPLDNIRPVIPSFQGASVSQPLTLEMSNQLNTLAKAHDATLFMLLNTVLSILLARHSNETDIVIGTAVANRDQAEISSLIGFFVNTVVLRSDLSDNPRFKQLLQRSKNYLLGAYEHQQVPFEKLVDKLQAERSLNHTPLFQVMLVLQNNEKSELSLPGLSITPVEQCHTAAKYDLSVNIVETEQGLIINWEYATELFHKSTIERMAGHFNVLLQGVLAQPDAKVYALPLLTPQEERQLLFDWNHTQANYPNDQCIHELFEAQVALNPHAVALVFERQQLNYATLNQKSNQLAHYLIEQGVKPDTLVGLCVEPSLDMIIGLLGILKAGGAYVPLDPNYPKSRISYMLEDSGVALLLTQTFLVDKLSINNQTLILLDQSKHFDYYPTTNIDKRLINLRPNHLAYATYTSGSTGQPKASLLQHNSLCNLTQAQSQYFNLSTSSKVLQCVSFGFDIASSDWVMALSFGAQLILPPQSLRKDPDKLGRYVAEMKVTHVMLIPVLLPYLTPDDWESVTDLMVIGESCALAVAQSWSKGRRFYNTYGPSETTAFSTINPFNKKDKLLHIGQAIANTQLYVLDTAQNLCPIGVPGELHIGGAGLSRGYLNREELTAEKFIKNPFSTMPNERLYKTGDLVRWLPDGNVDFIGRIDHQVKIRGFRIELGEIESVLNSHDAVSDVVVIARDEPKRLIAYIVRHTSALSESACIHSLRASIKHRLPDYMLPAAFVILDKIPLTPNGKIDRKALPSPHLTQQTFDQYRAPIGNVEEKLCGIWQALLKIERVGIDENFFDLGGHSLLAVRLIADIRACFNVDIKVSDIFSHQQISSLSAVIKAAELSRIPALVSAPLKEKLPLSFAQQSLWLLDQVEGRNNQYNMPIALQLNGLLNVSALTRALHCIVDRHQVLRTQINTLDSGEAIQVIQSNFDVNIPLIDLSTMSHEHQAQALAEHIEKEASTSFDFTQDLMIRARLLKRSAQAYVLLITQHHIASDGWSLAILMQELSALYAAFIKGKANPLDKINIQYGDYSYWQRNWLQGEILDQQLDYWVDKLQGLPEVHHLSLDNTRPIKQSFRGASVSQSLTVETTDQLNTFAQQQGVTLFMLLNTAFSVLLSRHANETDIVVGTPVANRNQVEITPLIGFFVNTLVLRSDLSANPRFDELLQASKDYLLGAYEHQQVPFEKLVDKLQPKRSLSHSPLFQVMLILQNNEQVNLRLPQLDIAPVELPHSTAKYDLTLNVIETGKGLTLSWEYATDLFHAATIKRLAGHFEVLLQGILEQPQSPVLALPLLTQQEKHQLSVEWNDTQADYPKDQCIHELFEAQVALNPHAVALVFDDQQLTYKQLNEKANQVAHYLIEKGVKPDHLIGLSVERSFDMVIGILAILKAGGAYVAFDPSYPEDRLSYMLKDSGVELLLTQSRLVSRFSLTIKDVIHVDHIDTFDHYPKTNTHLDRTTLTSSNLAYVIYTSGSTGKPKGILLTHKTLTNLCLWQPQNVFDHRVQRVLQFASLSFDVSAQEIFTSLSGGLSLYLCHDSQRRDMAELTDFIRKNAIDRIFVPYVVLEQLVSFELPSLMEVITAGEALKITPSMIEFFKRQPQTRLFNQYGPSESHVVTHYSLGKDVDSWLNFPAIGKPISNTTIKVLDEYQHAVPIGLVGELYVAGAGLARGYLHQPVLTEKKFILINKEKFYMTGDLVRWMPCGNLAFIGRVDDQVKIRGFRIEPGEIESVLLQHEHVSNLIVIACDEPKRLIAYVVTHKTTLSKRTFIESLRTWIKQRLPAYMMPSAFIIMDDMPLTPNGKIDRKALPAPNLTEQIIDQYSAPTNKVEEQLCEIWQVLLKIQRIGIRDNFFELGGHSLLAVRLISDIHACFNVDIKVSDIFSHQHISNLAAVIKTAKLSRMPALVSAPLKEKLPLSFTQQSLWLLDKIDSDNSQYNMPIALQMKGLLDIPSLTQALQTIIDRHHVLRTHINTLDSGEAIQEIQSNVSLTIPFIDLSAEPDEIQTQTLSEYIEKEASTSFDFTRDLMIRAQLVKQSAQNHVLLITLHHIASDGWSLGILMQELSTLYTAFTQGEENPFAELRIQYKDYAYWQRNWLPGDVLDKQLNYWTDKLQGLPEVHHLPLDKPRPAKQSFRGASVSQSLPLEVTNKLNAFAQQQGTTFFMLLSTAFAVLLSRHSNETDIVVGTPVANRHQAEIAPLIGVFVNTLVVRSDLSDNPNFDELLQDSKDYLLGAYEHQQVPFETLVDKLQPKRSLSHSSLFQVMLALQNNEQVDLTLPGLHITPVEQTHATAKYDLTLNVNETEKGLDLDWEYATDLFHAATIKRLAGHFEVLLQGILDHPQSPVLELPLLTQQEKHQLSVEWNDTQADYPSDQCIHELFEAQVALNPHAVALVFEHQQLSYATLNEKSNQLAHYLIEQGVKPDTLVGLFVEPSLDMIIGSLGILKAGGAYVALDSSYPESRISYMLEDSGVALLLTQASLVDKLSINGQTLIILDQVKHFENYPTTNIDKRLIKLNPNHLAYSTYTSGSTGQPKASLLQHSCLCNLSLTQAQHFNVSTSSKVLQLLSFGFDIATSDWVMALCFGAQLIVPPQSLRKDPIKLGHYVAEVKVTHVMLIPVLLPHLMPEDWTSVTDLMVIGESCALEVAQSWSEGRRFYNTYGPSETTAFSTINRFNKQDKVLHIGQAITNTQLYVLNAAQNLCPIGVLGELHIGGAGLSRGYLNKEALTAEKFIKNPFSTTANDRLYTTGDLVRWLPDGNIDFIGRIDHQVKIRGFRIELGEIEFAIKSHDAVSEVVVIARDEPKRLIAYIVRHTSALSEGECIHSLRALIKHRLPDYMLPAAFMIVDKMPLTPNGKIDRKALPAPNFTEQIMEAYIAPTNKIEEKLCEIWQALLKIERIGTCDNFFELGGHSLLVVRLTADIRACFNVDINVSDIFSHQQISGLSAVIEAATLSQVPTLEAVPSDLPLTLSFAQQSLWLLDKIDGNNRQYNMPIALQLDGPLDTSALTRALQRIVDRHQVLRTHINTLDSGEAIQVVQSPVQLSVPFIDFSLLPDQPQKQSLAEAVEKEASAAFDFTQGLMIRAQLLKRSEQAHVLLMTLHHIASDGWSLGILMQELSTLYTAFTQGEGNPLAALRIQYKDYAYWQRNGLQGDVLDKQLNYWTDKLQDLPDIHHLPLDKPRPAKQSFRGASISQALPIEITDKLNALAQQQGATLFMLLSTAFSVLLSRHSNETDIVIGTPVANRHQAELASLIGFFVNTLVLRSDLSANPRFDELLQSSKDYLLGAYEHQQVPFETLVDKLQPRRSLSHSPLFQVMLVLQNNEQVDLTLPGLSVTPVEQTHATAKYDLTLNVNETEKGLALDWEYATDLFHAATIKRLAGHFEVLLQGILEQPQSPVLELPLLTQQEKHQLSVEWNDTQADYPSDQCIHELFEAQVALTPNAVALVFEHQQLSYAVLNEKSNQLAHYLIEQGVKPDTLVALCAEPSFDMIIGSLAVLKAGGAYVPLDPSHPDKRLAYMLADSGVALLLTQMSLVDKLAINDQALIFLDEGETFAPYPKTNIDKLSLALTSNHLAYAIYTSGSTGQPKASLLQHNGLCNLLRIQSQTFTISTHSKVLQFASFGFDAATFEWVMALCLGAQLILLPSSKQKDPIELGRYVAEVGITHATLPPVILPSLNPENWISVTDLVVAGDSCPLKLAQLWSQGRRFYNAYGPSEATICTTINLFNQQDKILHIGQAIPNTQLYVLDKQQNLCPIGVAGELHIAGAGLSRGYLNREALTNEKFIKNPLSNMPNDRLYKTGDLVRWLPDGNVDFIGRIDHQVKIRGFRIELGEIESVINNHEAVSDVVVIARDEPKRLTAYVIANTSELSQGAFIQSLRTSIKHHLPNYMLPSDFVVVDAFPLTPNGKVDIKTLPEPGISKQLINKYVPPTTEIEKQLCMIWQKLLKTERIGIHDNFFALGGNSLLAVSLIGKINRVFSIDMPLNTLFNDPTIDDLSSSITLASYHGDYSHIIEITPLADHSVTPLFLVAGISGNSIGFYALAQQLGRKIPVYALEPKGLDGIDEPICSMASLAEFYITLIKGIQPQGPYRLTGHSFGGHVVYEIACQLEQTGDSVSMLAVLDSTAPVSIAKKPCLPNNEVEWLQYQLAILAQLYDVDLSAEIEAVKTIKPALFNDHVQQLLTEYLHVTLSMNQVKGFLNVMRTQLSMGYAPESNRYTGPMTVIRAMAEDNNRLAHNHPPHTEDDLGWGHLTQQTPTSISVPGQHITMLNDPFVSTLANELKKLLLPV